MNKRLLVTLISVTLLVLCLCGSIGGSVWYKYNVEAKKEALEKTKKTTEVQADKEFEDAYNQWLFAERTGEPEKDLWALDSEYREGSKNKESLGKQRDEVMRSGNTKGLLEICDLIKDNLDKQDSLIHKVQRELEAEDAAIQNLNETAQKLSTEEKRKKALKIAQLVREATSLSEDYIVLYIDEIELQQQVNELYILLAKGQINTKTFSTRLKDHQPKEEENVKAIDDKGKETGRKRDLVHDEWAKLKPLLNLDQSVKLHLIPSNGLCLKQSSLRLNASTANTSNAPP